jgi:mitochondrial division protein 1
LDPIVTESSASNGAGMSRMDFVSKAIMAPFNHKKADSVKILADRNYSVFHWVSLILF